MADTEGEIASCDDVEIATGSTTDTGAVRSSNVNAVRSAAGVRIKGVVHFDVDHSNRGPRSVEQDLEGPDVPFGD